MSAEQALLKAYAEWRRLAEAEGRAVRRRDWKFLLECQQALKKIQPLITLLTFAARKEWKLSGADCAANEEVLRAVVQDLIELGRRNRKLLQAARESALAKRDQLDQASRNLKRLQTSYLAQRPADWTSFS
jgi:hypothetical protein